LKAKKDFSLIYYTLLLLLDLNYIFFLVNFGDPPNLGATIEVLVFIVCLEIFRLSLLNEFLKFKIEFLLLSKEVLLNEDINFLF